MVQVQKCRYCGDSYRIGDENMAIETYDGWVSDICRPCQTESSIDEQTINEQRIDLICDECKGCFSVDQGIGLSMLAFADEENGGDPILCPECCPSAQWAQEEYGDANER